ncbi:response regulator [Luteimonas sp. BDR2-5]|uniref:hybrid sensor histidine kinase/response regulator n=1 Tax=Proluteimonas luteida TaxID=2878685 RepID=UPI001E44CF0D|nr:ATP-binding protein [Luteimonas sp. BDR2-5]MCD9029860.1 response regulator [Luteimonas sp. BDR2-5]
MCGLALLAGMAMAAAPETPRLRIIGVADGLPASEAMGLAQDRDGYVWAATADGLARLDGTSVRVWHHDPGDPASISGNALQALHVDAENRVWVAGQEGAVSILDAARSGFRHIPDDTWPDFKAGVTWDFASRPGEMWLATGGLGIYGTRDGKLLVNLRHVPGDPHSLPSDRVVAIDFDEDGTLWAATTGGLASYDGQRVQRIELPGDPQDPLVLWTGVVDGEVWAGATSGLYRRDADGQWQQPRWGGMFARPNLVQAMVRDHEGGYWIGTLRGLWRVAGGNSVPVPVPLGPSVGRSTAARQLLLQEDGALWVAASGEGLAYLRSDWRGIGQLANREGGLGGWDYESVGRARDGGLWFASADGFIEHIDRNANLTRLSGPAAQELRGQRLQAIVEDDAGALWVGLRNGLVRITLDGELKKWMADSPRDPSLGSNYAVLVLGPGGTLWASSQGNGIEQRDIADGRVLFRVEAPVDPEQRAPPGGQGAHAIAIDADGQPWAATEAGLARFDPDARRFVPVDAAWGEAVFGVGFDGPDALWLHRQRELLRLVRRDGDWQADTSVGVAEGLPGLLSHGLRVDARHRVWLSTRRGFYRWDPAERKLRHYGLQHGLASQEMLPRSLGINADGLLAAGTSAGTIVLLDTTVDEDTTRAPRLQLAGLDVRRDGDWRRLEGEHIQLLPDDREFRIDAHLLSYDDPMSNTYWSRLDGLDGDWVRQGASGQRTFSNLPPGRYRLRMRASDTFGNMSGEQSLAIDVLPPWWRTPWALAGFGLLALLLLALAAYLYLQRLRRRTGLQIIEHKRELAEQASQAKSRFLATLGHEVRTPMTGVLGMSELLLDTPLEPRQRGYAEAIRRAGEHLMRLVNDALDLARIEAGRLELDPQPFDLHALVQDVVALSAPMARHKSLGFDTVFDEATPTWVRGDAMRVRQILLNLLGNAVKFTEQGSVGLQVGRGPAGEIRFVVSDTGPGLNEEQRQRLFRRFEQAEGARTASRYGGSGLGLAISQELAAAMSGRIDVDSTPGEGTRFNVTLPLPVVDDPPRRSGGGVRERLTAAVGLEILLVEDDQTVADVITGLLRSQGHEVVHVMHGLAALSEVATRSYDLALLDLDLPGVDGLTLAGLLREQGFGQPIVAVTARADAGAEPAALAAGFNGFLRKPLTGEMLSDVLAASWRPAPSVDGDPDRDG